MFPGFAHEYVAMVPGISNGSTLHLASDDDDFDAESSAAVHLLDRAAVVLGRAVAHARAAAAAAVAGGQRSARQFEKRMIQADKLATFGQLAAGVVHELNNPLTSIVAYSEYLIRKATDGVVLETADVDRLRRIQESANRMLRFTRELVSYTRPSTGPAGPVALHDVLDKAVAFCEHVLSEAGVRVERRYAREVVTVRGVHEQLVQVFVNLLTNACQAARPSEGEVVLTTALRGARTSSRATTARFAS
jgi:C4-dicarboxylate-specific signal transduction histidine kinase